jgi:DNA-3-methyladenine glycosylase
MKLDVAFLQRDTVEVARELLGCHLIHRTTEGLIRVRITETEAYRGADDPASHAYRGVTPRNELMFGEVGRLYVYFIYGMHECMNIVAHAPDSVGAVLLRAGVPLEGLELVRRNRPGVADKQLMNGPGKLTKAMGIDRSFNGYDLLTQETGVLTLERHASTEAVQATPRIGITRGKELLWRFICENP